MVSFKLEVYKIIVKELKILFSYRGKKISSIARKFKIRTVNAEKRIEQLTAGEAIALARMIEQKQRLLQIVR